MLSKFFKGSVKEQRSEGTKETDSVDVSWVLWVLKFDARIPSSPRRRYTEGDTPLFAFQRDVRQNEISVHWNFVITRYGR